MKNVAADKNTAWPVLTRSKVVISQKTSSSHPVVGGKMDTSLSALHFLCAKWWPTIDCSFCSHLHSCLIIGRACCFPMSAEQCGNGNWSVYLFIVFLDVICPARTDGWCVTYSMDFKTDSSRQTQCFFFFFVFHRANSNYDLGSVPSLYFLKWLIIVKNMAVSEGLMFSFIVGDRETEINLSFSSDLSN